MMPIFLLLSSFGAGALSAVHQGDAVFQAWMARYGKSYASPSAYEHARLNYFENSEIVANHNSNSTRTWTMGLGPFADLSDAEFSRRHVAFKPRSPPINAEYVASLAAVEVPDALDWSQQGKVSPVRDQGHCGACWTFGTVGSIESQYAIASGKDVVPLSTQDVLSCMSEGSPLNTKEDGFACGCSGGDPDGLMHWVKRNGIEAWAGRPYTNVTANCDGMNDPAKANCDCDETGLPKCPAKPKCPDLCPASERKPIVTVDGYTALPGGKENTTLIQAVSKGPVTVLVDCEATPFKSYKSGIITEGCEGIHNHVVLIVGFGTEGGVDYWKVKNSFGKDWGEDGYVRIARDKDLCGIGGEPYVPMGAKAWSH